MTGEKIQKHLLSVQMYKEKNTKVALGLGYCKQFTHFGSFINIYRPCASFCSSYVIYYLVTTNININFIKYVFFLNLNAAADIGIRLQVGHSNIGERSKK